MRLKKYNNNYNKRTAIAILGILISFGGISIYRSYATYQENKSYNVIKGTIPDFGYDVKFAVLVDEQKTNEIPTEPKNKDGKYYKVNVDCGNSKTTGEWDYNAWNVKLENVEEGSRCKLLFTSTLSEDEYNKYIDAGVALRRNTYRGKDITQYHTDGTLYKMISSGKFDDIYVGDYITTTEGNHEVTWLIADLDNYLYSGDSTKILTQHHATVIPAKPLTTAKMNETNDTTGGYVGSDMVKTTLPEILSTYIKPVFEEHVIQYRNLLSKSVNKEAPNNKFDNAKGVSNNWEWYERELDLMSEMNVYGGTVVSSSMYDTGIDNRQYAIFQLKPEFTNSYGISSLNYWLKDVVDSTSFANVYNYGFSGASGATTLLGVRPRFLID